MNVAVALAIAVAGPGRYSLDRLLGIRLPWPLVGLSLGATAAASAMGALTEERQAEQPMEMAGAELQGGVGASAHPAAAVS